MTRENPTPSNKYWLCPLYSFHCDSESVGSTEGIQIKPAPIELKNFLRERYPFESKCQIDNPCMFDWVIFIPCSEKAIEGNTIDNTVSGKEGRRAYFSLMSFIVACRLLKKGSITPGTLIFINQQGSIWSTGPEIDTYISKNGWTRYPRYEFRQSDITESNSLMRDFSRHLIPTKSNVLHVALTRFNSAYHSELNDSLIEQMIAFESLYMGDDKELAYKLALRTAFLLGRSLKSREDIYRKMRKAYALRGQIVHGIKSPERKEVQEMIPETEEYLRQSIRRFNSLIYHEGYSMREIRERLLDENIINNGRILALKE